MSQLRFSDAHVWVRIDDDVAVLGLSDYLQDQMGEITSLNLPTWAMFCARSAAWVTSSRRRRPRRWRRL